MLGGLLLRHGDAITTAHCESESDRVLSCLLHQQHLSTTLCIDPDAAPNSGVSLGEYAAALRTGRDHGVQ